MFINGQLEQEWHPLVEGHLQTQALEAARFVAERMSDPVYVSTVAAKVSQQTLKSNLTWYAPSITFGFASITLLYAFFARCFPEEKWEMTAHHYLRLAAEGTLTSPMTEPAFFYGTSGLAALTSLLSNQGQYYGQTLRNLHEHLQRQVVAKQWLRKGTKGVALEDYDLIGGVSGILAYLLTITTPDKYVLSLIQTLIEYLIWLAGTDTQTMRERWYVPPDLFAAKWLRDYYPNGYFNSGMAHGIAGPLAVLAKTWQQGYHFPGLREAIVLLSRWLIEHIVSDEWGINWPPAFPLQDSQKLDDWKMLPLARASWCSGAPGISRALWLAGTALNDQELCQISLEAIEAVLRRPINLRNIDAPILCHGVAGLLTICLHFSHEAKSLNVQEHISPLVTQIIDVFNPTFPFGFRDIEGTNVSPEGIVSVDHPGWIEGAAGVALALLAAATSVPPTWDRYLLIS